MVQVANCSSGCASLNGSVGFSFSYNTADYSRLQRWSGPQSPQHLTSDGMKSPAAAVAAVTDQKLTLCELLRKAPPPLRWSASGTFCSSEATCFNASELCVVWRWWLTHLWRKLEPIPLAHKSDFCKSQDWFVHLNTEVFTPITVPWSKNARTESKVPSKQKPTVLSTAWLTKHWWFSSIILVSHTWTFSNKQSSEHVAACYQVFKSKQQCINKIWQSDGSMTLETYWTVL